VAKRSHTLVGWKQHCLGDPRLRGDDLRSILPCTHGTEGARNFHIKEGVAKRSHTFVGWKQHCLEDPRLRGDDLWSFCLALAARDASETSTPGGGWQDARTRLCGATCTRFCSTIGAISTLARRAEVSMIWASTSQNFSINCALQQLDRSTHP
jgi:hypothetical protein